MGQQKQDFIEVARGSETLLIAAAGIVAVQTRGEIHVIHTTGGPITVSREAAADVRDAWRKLTGDPAAPGSAGDSTAGKLFARP
jgi:hypothetical protein